MGSSNWNGMRKEKRRKCLRCCVLVAIGCPAIRIFAAGIQRGGGRDIVLGA